LRALEDFDLASHSKAQATSAHSMSVCCSQIPDNGEDLALNR
jgi:hypothetical protein